MWIVCTKGYDIWVLDFYSEVRKRNMKSIRKEDVLFFPTCLRVSENFWPYYKAL